MLLLYTEDMPLCIFSSSAWLQNAANSSTGSIVKIASTDENSLSTEIVAKSSSNEVLLAVSQQLGHPHEKWFHCPTNVYKALKVPGWLNLGISTSKMECHERVNVNKAHVLTARLPAKEGSMHYWIGKSVATESLEQHETKHPAETTLNHGKLHLRPIVWGPSKWLPKPKLHLQVEPWSAAR